jgi:hypothetical protein
MSSFLNFAAVGAMGAISQGQDLGTCKLIKSPKSYRILVVYPQFKSRAAQTDLVVHVSGSLREQARTRFGVLVSGFGITYGEQKSSAESLSHRQSLTFFL